MRWRAPDGDFAVVAGVTDDGEEVTLDRRRSPTCTRASSVEVGGRLARARHARLALRGRRTCRAAGPAQRRGAAGRTCASIKHVGPRGARVAARAPRRRDVLDDVDRDPRARAARGAGHRAARGSARPWRSWEDQRRAARCGCSSTSTACRPRSRPRVERAFGPEAIELLRADPYAADRRRRHRLRDRRRAGPGAGHRPRRRPERLDAGLLHALREAERDGHCHLPRAELRARAARLLGADASDRVDALARAGRLVARRRPRRRPGDGPRRAAPGPRTCRELLDDEPRAAPGRRRAPADGRTSCRPTTSGRWSTRCSAAAWRSSPAARAPARRRRCARSSTCCSDRRRTRAPVRADGQGRAAPGRDAPARRRRRSTGCSSGCPARASRATPDDPIPATDVLVVDEASMLDVRAGRRAARRRRAAHARAARRRRRPARRRSAPAACSTT